MNLIQARNLRYVVRLIVIVIASEIITKLFFDYMGWHGYINNVVTTLLSEVFSVTLSLYPAYLWVYLPLIAEQSRDRIQAFALTEALQAVCNRVVITDTSGTVLYVNKAYTNATGFTESEIVGRPSSILDAGNQDELYHMDVKDSLARYGKWHGEVWVKHKDGTLTHEMLDVRVVRDSHDAMEFFVGVYSDIDMAEEQEGSTSNILQAQKLESIGTLVSGVAHNFNNLLTAISGKAYLGQSTAKEDSSESKHLADIQNLSNDASVLIKQLLSFARESTHEKKYVNLVELAFDAVDTARFGLTMDIEMSVTSSEQCMMTYVDPVYIKQVIINLINNARDAMENAPTKRITISIESHQDGVGQSNPMAIINVEDTGCGINESDISKLFKPFFTTKDSGKGTGLGLSTANEIIQAHNGSMSVKSILSKGTTFSIFLPIVEGPEKSVQGKGFALGEEC